MRRDRLGPAWRTHEATRRTRDPFRNERPADFGEISSDPPLSTTSVAARVWCVPCVADRRGGSTRTGIRSFPQFLRTGPPARVSVDRTRERVLDAESGGHRWPLTRFLAACMCTAVVIRRPPIVGSAIRCRVRHGTREPTGATPPRWVSNEDTARSERTVSPNRRQFIIGRVDESTLLICLHSAWTHDRTRAGSTDRARWPTALGRTRRTVRQLASRGCAFETVHTTGRSGPPTRRRVGVQASESSAARHSSIARPLW